MKDHNVNLYDLKLAQQILSALAPAAKTVARKKVAEEIQQPFLRFPRQHSAGPPPVTGDALRQVPDIPAQSDQVVPPEQFTTWEDCIQWCLAATRAEAAFVVDSQGFIIASCGLTPPQGFECAGAEMICSLDQLERIDSDAGKLSWMDLDFSRRRIVGFVTPSETAEYFIVGLVAPDPARFFSHKPAISRQIEENLSRID